METGQLFEGKLMRPGKPTIWTTTVLLKDLKPTLRDIARIQGWSEGELWDATFEVVNELTADAE